MNTEEPIPWNCLTINDDTEASICLRKIRLLTKDLKERSKCNAINQVTILQYSDNVV